MSLSNSCNDFVFDMEGNNFMPQRYKKKPYRFSCASDILLLKEVIAVNPYSTLNQRQKWEEVAENLREHFLVDGRRCRERTTLILNYFLSEENSTFRKVGTEEDIKERDKILQELTELKAVSEAVAYSTAKSAAKNTNKSQKDGDIERSLESLSASLEERNNAMSSSSSDEKDDTSSSSKRKRMKREIIDNYLEKKRAAELALKKEELALKKVELAQEQQRINMEKEKFEIEKRERQARFEIEMDIKRTEREERRAMSDLIKQLLSMQHNISLHNPEEVIKPN